MYICTPVGGCITRIMLSSRITNLGMASVRIATQKNPILWNCVIGTNAWHTERDLNDWLQYYYAFQSVIGIIMNCTFFIFKDICKSMAIWLALRDLKRMHFALQRMLNVMQDRISRKQVAASYLVLNSQTKHSTFIIYWMYIVRSKIATAVFDHKPTARQNK